MRDDDCKKRQRSKNDGVSTAEVCWGAEQGGTTDDEISDSRDQASNGKFPVVHAILMGA